MGEDSSRPVKSSCFLLYVQRNAQTLRAQVSEFDVKDPWAQPSNKMQSVSVTLESWPHPFPLAPAHPKGSSCLDF